MNQLLNEIGALVVKQKCTMLFKQGYTREQVNELLNEDLIPELNDWVAHIMRGFHESESSAGQTIN
jgi:hypothetical protein